LKLVRRGGLIAVDNTLALSGAPIIELGSRSTHAQAMLAFNELACKDERVDEAMLTVGEGLTLLRVR
jgi:predicted O-methyltransferase YrrM